MTGPKKELGQHWLTDRTILAAIAETAEIDSSTTVLEIGPGQGTLTSELLRRAGKVIAVEFDADLARKLPGQFPGTNLSVINEDILTFDVSHLPADYVVVANVPYYITSKIVQKLMTADNPPRTTVILVQKEVAQRIAAEPGDMSLLALSAQVYAEASLGIEVPREFFTPPPKVDSQVVILERRQTPLIDETIERQFWRAAKAGFIGKRKKLRGSLAAGLAMEKPVVDALLEQISISPGWRAEDLSVNDWLRLAKALT